MDRILVRFPGDNDFSITVKAFVETIASNILLNEWTVTKERIVDLFNETAGALYILHQGLDSFDYQENHLRYKKYLQIRVKDVYFDQEIDEFIKSKQCNNDGCLAVLGYGKIEYYII